MITSTKIADIDFGSYICNASGVNDTTVEELTQLAASKSAAIVVKSATIESRVGNPEPRLAHTDIGIIQSMGWPNLGYKEYIKIVPELKKLSNKPIIASVAGFCDEDYVTITAAYQNSDVDLIEISLSCPNIDGHPQAGYDYEKAGNLLKKLNGLGKKPIGVKLPPYLDSAKQEQMAKIITDNNISFVTCINSPGNALIIDPDTEATLIKPREGFGGLCGEYIKPIALGNVRGFYNLFRDKDISIIGVGGISTGRDAFEFLLAGADAVQVGSILEKEGLSCLERIDNELANIMESKGYKTISEARGKLKTI